MQAVEEVEKVGMVKLQLFELMFLTQLLPAFKTPTYGDGKLIEGVLKFIESVDQASLTTPIFEKYGIKLGERIEPTHPFFHQINTECMALETELTKEQTGVFDLDLYIKLTEGLNVNYRERSMLEHLLVK